MNQQTESLERNNITKKNHEFCSQHSRKNKRERFIQIDGDDGQCHDAGHHDDSSLFNYDDYFADDRSSNHSAYIHDEHDYSSMYYHDNSTRSLTLINMNSGNICRSSGYHYRHASPSSPSSLSSGYYSSYYSLTTINCIQSAQLRQQQRERQIESIIDSRKTWPVGITTRAAIRMMRQQLRKNQQDADSNNRNDNENLKMDNAIKSKESNCSNDPDFGLIKLKLIRILVFGSMMTHNSKVRPQKIFLRRCRDNFIMKQKQKTKEFCQKPSCTASNNDLLSIYQINYACGRSLVSLELCFVQWPDSFVAKSDFYHETFDKYFQMARIAIGYYDPYDLESIEHMQSWLKAFYQYHNKSNNGHCRHGCPINSIIIRLDDQPQQNRSSKWFASIRNVNNYRFDHVISSLLNQYGSSIHHLTIKYSLFRRPSLKPLWKMIYKLIVIGRIQPESQCEDGNDDTLVIDSVKNVEAKFRKQRKRRSSISNKLVRGRKSFGKSFGNFLRSLTENILRSFWKFVGLDKQRHSQ